MFPEPKTGGFNFPQPLAEKYRPRTVDDFIGVDKPKKVMQAFIRRPYPKTAWLFLGGSGTGKTSMALAIAEQLGAELHHIPSQNCDLETIENTCRMCHYVPRNGGFHLVLIDEADRMTPAAQIALLSKLDATAFPPNTIFIFTANCAEALQDRFLSRCRILEFQQDSLALDLPAYLQKVYKRETKRSCPLAMAEQIARDSNNNARDALMCLEISIMAGD